MNLVRSPLSLLRPTVVADAVCLSALFFCGSNIKDLRWNGLVDPLNDQGDSPVGRIHRIIRDPEKLIGISAYLRYLAPAHAILLQQPPR